MSGPPPSSRVLGASGWVCLGMGSVLLGGCATPGSLGLVLRGPVSQITDTATSGCLRSPACTSAAPGEESLIPWLSRAADTARAVATLKEFLDAAEVQRIEETLVKCAREANFQVNDADEALKGASPSAAQCQEIVRREGGQDITRARDFGIKKHALAFECIRKNLGELFADSLSIEPRYQWEPSTGLWRWLDPRQVAEWLRMGLASKLKGSLVPDIVFHALGDPNKVQLVYDLKFPCPASNEPEWNDYPKGHPHHPQNQGGMYEDALGGQLPPARVSPQFGVSR